MLLLSDAVPGWARCLACAFTGAAAVVGVGMGRAWWLMGDLPFEWPGVFGALGLAWVLAVFAWVAVTGTVPKFFALGAMRIPPRVEDDGR